MKDPLFPQSQDPELIDVPELAFIAVDGSGDPDTSQRFQDAIGALYGVSYGIKMSPKKNDAPKNYAEFTVGALEGLWWVEGQETPDVTSEEARGTKDNWSWTLLIRQPGFVTEAVVGHFKEQLRAKKDNPVIDDVRFERFAEGRCVQMMHIGPYDTEQATIDRMKSFATDQGLELVGKHHEIYLGDPRRAEPGKLRTILRHPAAPHGERSGHD